MNQLNHTFSALADPTRRAILARLAAGDATVTELAEPFDISLPAISRHLKVLEEAALIERGREGKHRPCRLRKEALAQAREWLDFHARFWSGSLDRLADHLKRKNGDRKMSTGIDESLLVMTRIFDAPRERVFDAWMEHGQFESWIGPEGQKCEVPLMESRVGGRYRFNMKMSDGNTIFVGGIYQVIDRPHRIVLTWGWDGDPERTSTITLTFRAVGGKTELTLRQEGLKTVENRDGHNRGWTSAFNKLESYLQETRK